MQRPMFPLALALAFALVTRTEAQQATDSLPSPTTLGRADAELPEDRLADLLALLPGVGSLNSGELSVHGAGPTANAAYLDGVPITPGYRNLGSPLFGGSWFGAVGPGIAIGTNAFETLSLTAAIGAGEFAGARGGILRVESRRPGPEMERGMRLRAGWGSDAVFGRTSGLNFNRVTLNGDGAFGGFSADLAIVVEGQGTARLGLEQNDSPVFLSNGVDTTVAVVTSSGDPATVDVFKFTPSPGVEIPSSATSSYSILARAAYQVSEHQRLQVTAVASQQQAREFDYVNLYNSAQQWATRGWSRVFTVGWLRDLKRREGLGLAAEAHLSYQTDESTEGPLTTAGDLDSRSPWGGFLLSPLDFRFDAKSFPVNDALIHNFRSNTGRRTPYDLNQTSQYALVDLYRNNAYGLTGFSESGGPIGRLDLHRERRVVGKAVLDLDLGGRHHLRAGTELVWYDIHRYSSALTNLVFADAYVESPNRQAFFVNYRLRLAPATVSADIRYDRYHSGAERPYYTDPATGKRTWFPEVASLRPVVTEAFLDSIFVEDPSHGALSGSLRASWDPSPALTLWGAIGAAAQLPDLAAVYQGVNTDLGVTNVNQKYGSSLDFERATVGELGGRHRLTDRIDFSASLWLREEKDLTAERLVSVYRPSQGQNQDIRLLTSMGKGNSRGLDARLGLSFGERGHGWVNYSYVDATVNLPAVPSFTSAQDVASPDARPHTLAAAVLFTTPADNRVFGGLLARSGVFADLRIASGTAYTRCPADEPNDASIISGEVCSRGIEGEFNGARLPAVKLVDLRVTRGIPVGGTTITAFADARNLFNARNVTQVFAQTGKTTNRAERGINRQAALDSYANEALLNGVRLTDGTIDLSFGGAPDPRGGCGMWITTEGRAGAPNCVYLIEAERRFGNGDHLFTLAEQTRASDAFYNVLRGLQNFTGPGRRVRVGVEVAF